MLNRRLLILALAASVLAPIRAAAQGTVLGQEQTIIYTGTLATLAAPNTPVNNFATPGGTNTFIVPVANPTVSIRVYVTNNTANACTAFTVQMFAATDNTVTSFNNNLANWQVVPLQSPAATGGLVSIVGLSIPASGAAYVSSTAISSTRVAIQLSSGATGSCATTTVEATAEITQVAVSSPLISTNTNTPTGGVTGNVQGIVPNQVNGANVNPVVSGSLQPPINTGFQQAGIDSITTAQIQVSQNGVQSYAPQSPTPSNAGETTVVFTTVPGNGTILAPWTCNQPAAGPTCGGLGNGSDAVAVLNNTPSNTPFQISCNNCNNQANQLATYITWAGTVTLRNGEAASNTNTKALVNSLAAGSIEVFTAKCNAQPCFLTGVTDTQGNTYKQVSVLPGFGNGLGFKGETVWATTKGVVGGADTITATLGSGVASPLNDILASEIQCTGSACPTSALNQPNIANQADTLGNQITLTDQTGANEFTCSATISTNTTTQLCAIPTTINGVSVRLYITDMQINVTVAGTASTLTLVQGTGATCASNQTNLSAIVYPTTVVSTLATLNGPAMGPRTPLIAPVGAGVCATTAGTGAATLTIELRGFLNP
jgi:hypothetical protein